MIRQVERLYPEDGGATHVFITGANRDRLKPFVLFDAGPIQSDRRWGLPWHPHSGVATLTFPYLSDLYHEDTGGNRGVIREGGFQWMQAGGGIWHKEEYEPNAGRIGIHQLWVQLPPDEESGPVRYWDVQPEEVMVNGNTRVFLGGYEGVESSAEVPVSMSYLDVTLAAGDEWRYGPPPEQTRGFVFVRTGAVSIGGVRVGALRLAMLAENEAKIVLRAEDASQLVVVVAEPSPYAVVAAGGQMHTTPEALDGAGRRIAEIGQELRRQGKV